MEGVTTMKIHDSLKISRENKVISLAGGGGKTTSLYALAKESAYYGRKTVMMTTTHIGLPRQENIDVYEKPTVAELRDSWKAGRIVAVGNRSDDGRMTCPEESIYQLVCKNADAIYIEVDGSRGIPLKYPDWYEPVIPQNTSQTLVFSGVSVLGMPFDTHCHRAKLAREKLGIEEKIINEEIMARVLLEGYGKYHPTYILNHADTSELILRGKNVADFLYQGGAFAVSVVSLHKILEMQEGAENGRSTRKSRA